MATSQFIQRAYIAFFNRPADKAGFDFWQGYSGPDHDLLNQFAESAEYLSDFAGKGNREIIGIVYQNLFGRPPESDGWNYWEAQMNAGWVTVGNAAYEILGGAQGTDLATINNKTTAAQIFTNSLETTSEINAYAKAGNNGVGHLAKDWLATVSYSDASLETALHNGNDVFIALINANAPWDYMSPWVPPVYNVYIAGGNTADYTVTIPLVPNAHSVIRWEGFNNGLLSVENFYNIDGYHNNNTCFLDLSYYWDYGAISINAATLNANGHAVVPVPLSDIGNQSSYSNWILPWSTGTETGYITFTRPNASTTVYKIEMWTGQSATVSKALSAYNGSVLTNDEYFDRALKNDPLLSEFAYSAVDQKDTAQLIGYIDVGREFDGVFMSEHAFGAPAYYDGYDVHYI